MSLINFIRLISPNGETWEHYARQKWGVRVTRFHGWLDGKQEQAWSKTLSRQDATLRWKALKAKGWRETARRNPSGEWWIDDSGTALYADGDVGDMGHEAYVIDGLTRRILDELEIEYNEEGPGDLSNYRKEIDTLMKEEGFDGLNGDFIDSKVKHIWKDPEQRDDAIIIAFGAGDARKYGMQYDGWKRVKGNDVETWTLTTSDLKAITNGLWDASGGDDIPEDEVFNIYVFSTKMWYQDVPWSVLSEDDPGKLRIYGTKDNPLVRLKKAKKLPNSLKAALQRGARVEMEHTRSKRAALIIASQHLAEDPRYYHKLAKMERRRG